MKIKLTKAKIKSIIKPVAWFFIDLYGWHRSIIILVFKGIKSARIFYGYGHYKMSCRYAEKRARKWKSFYDQKGKLQGMFPIKEKLLICSELEIKHFQKKGYLTKNVSYRKYFKRASYFKSKLNYKK